MDAIYQRSDGPTRGDGLWRHHGGGDTAELPRTFERLEREALLRAYGTGPARLAHAVSDRTDAEVGEWVDLALRQLLELYADHIERHLRRIGEVRESLGRPLVLSYPFEAPLYPLPERVEAR